MYNVTNVTHLSTRSKGPDSTNVTNITHLLTRSTEPDSTTYSTGIPSIGPPTGNFYVTNPTSQTSSRHRKGLAENTKSYNTAGKPCVRRSRCTHLRFMSPRVPTCDKMAVEQAVLLAFRTRRHRRTTGVVRDKVDCTYVDKAALEAGAVDDSKDAPFAVTHNN